MNICKICGKETISPVGKKSSFALIIKDKLSEDKDKNLVLLTADEKRLLKTYLGFVGIPLEEVRITSLWLHRADVKNVEDKEWNYQQAMLEAMDKKLVLLLGTTTTKFFVKANATDCSGLDLTSSLLSTKHLYGTRTLQDAMRYPIGEFEITLDKFTKTFMEIWEKANG